MNAPVDTSVWIDHLRHGNAALVGLIGPDLVLTHPMVVLEIACGTPPAPRAQTLGNLGFLRVCHQASLAGVMEFIGSGKLYGLRCGLAEMALLACAFITPGTALWTLDTRLADLAGRFGVPHQPTPH